VPLGTLNAVERGLLGDSSGDSLRLLLKSQGQLKVMFA
jgi:hypothetical protein